MRLAAREQCLQAGHRNADNARFAPNTAGTGNASSVAFVVVANGCSRAKYRLQADREAYDVIAERNADPRWCATDYGIEMDPRSRYFDPYNPDRSPMPADDPTSHQYMQAGRREERLVALG